MNWRAGAWAGAWVGALLLSTLLALSFSWGGNVAFIGGALVILASIGFIGTGSDTRFRIIRNMMGIPIAKEEQDPAKRRIEISTGVKVFLVGVALWLPLLYFAFRA